MALKPSTGYCGQPNTDAVFFPKASHQITQLDQSKRGLQAYGGGSISRDCAVRFSLVIHRSQRLQLEPNCIVHRHSILPR